MKQLIYIEADGALNHPLCQPGGPFIAMPIIGCRPYEDPTPKTKAAIDYFRKLNFTDGRAVIRIDMGHTFAFIGWTEVAESGKKILLGPDADEAIQGYTSGCLNYRKKVNIPEMGYGGGWVGSEFSNLMKVADLFQAAGISPTIYLDGIGESTLTPWQLGSNPEIEKTLAGISKSTRAHLLGFPSVYNPHTDWAAWIKPSYLVTDTTGVRMCRDAGFTGDVVMGTSCAVDLPCRNDGRPQPASLPVKGRLSNAGWYAPGPMITAACVLAKQIHEQAGETYVAHFSLPDLGVDELVARIRFGGPEFPKGIVVLWGPDDSLSKLQDISTGLTTQKV